MRRVHIRLLGISALAIGTALALPAASQAYPGGGIFSVGYVSPNPFYYGYNYTYGSPYGYGCGYNGSPYSNRSGYYGAYNNQGSGSYYGAAPMTASYQSFYSGAGTDSSAAIIDMRVPGDAQVWIGSSTTEQGGVSRSFVSPPLESGKTYAYEVRARWLNNGQVVENTKSVQIRAGDRVRVDFMDANATNGLATAPAPSRLRTEGNRSGAEGTRNGAVQSNNGNVNPVVPSSPATSTTNPYGTVTDGVFVPSRGPNLQPTGVVAPGAQGNQPAGANPSNLPPAGTVNPNQYPRAGQNAPPAGQNTPAGQSAPNQLPAGQTNPNQIPAGQVNPNTPTTPVPGQTAPSPSTVPPKQ